MPTVTVVAHYPLSYTHRRTKEIEMELEYSMNVAEFKAQLAAQLSLTTEELTVCSEGEARQFMLCYCNYS